MSALTLMLMLILLIVAGARISGAKDRSGGGGRLLPVFSHRGSGGLGTPLSALTLTVHRGGHRGSTAGSTAGSISYTSSSQGPRNQGNRQFTDRKTSSDRDRKSPATLPASVAMKAACAVSRVRLRAVTACFILFMYLRVARQCCAGHARDVAPRAE
jgi:hypothetical protein